MGRGKRLSARASGGVGGSAAAGMRGVGSAVAGMCSHGWHCCGTDERCLYLREVLDQSKIGQFDVSVEIEQQVVGLDVAMDVR